MNVQTCASSHKATSWQSIDWQTANKYVKKLQMRIVKAQKEGHCNKVKSLQWMLTHSFYAKALAVKRVTSNAGKKTSGIDHELWISPEAKFNAITTLDRRGYRPKPLKRVYIPKKNGKMRPLSIPVMKDRAMQTLYKFAVEPIAETTADLNSYGFRVGRCTQDAIAHAFTCLGWKRSSKWVLEGDIKGCFDHISHEWLMENIPMDKEVLGKWLKCGFVDANHLFPTEEGTPQGGTISPVLMNMTLDGLERQLKAHIPEYRRIDGEARYTKLNFIRYADDFIITGETKEFLQTEVLPIVELFLQERGLQLSQEKTTITHIEDGFDFLGQTIRKFNEKLIITPSKKSVQAFLSRIRTIINSNKTTTQEELIYKLNPIIRGWVNYHRYVVSSKIFSWVDNQIHHCLWHWAKRRHNTKGLRWVKDRYWHTIDTRNWVFASKKRKEHSEQEWHYTALVKASDTKIIRFRKIKSEANPFDLAWEGYFEERDGERMLNSTRGREKLLATWRKQKRCCPVCQKAITSDTGFTTHILQKTPRQKLYIMVHPDCHKQLHDPNYLI